MVKRVMTQFTAGEVRRLREELNEWGEPKWTGVEIAVVLGVSESTVWRVLSRQAAYAKMGKVEHGGLTMEVAAAAMANSGGGAGQGLDAAAAASEERFLAKLAAGSAGPAGVSPLDEEQQALVRRYYE